MLKKEKAFVIIEEPEAHLYPGLQNKIVEFIAWNLKDVKSDQNSFMPIEVNDEKVDLAEPDGKLIPDILNQHKCDFLIYCQNKPQTCFIELKGENISVKDSYNPYSQIIDMINYLQKEKELKCLVSSKIERHAFIVSPGIFSSSSILAL